jgi:hypothetical protein
MENVLRLVRCQTSQKPILPDCTLQPITLSHCRYCVIEALCGIIQVQCPVRRKAKITTDQIAVNEETAFDFVHKYV